MLQNTVGTSNQTLRLLQLKSKDAEFFTVTSLMTCAQNKLVFRFLARDAFVRTNRRAIAIMFVRLSVGLSVWDGHAL